MSAVGAKECSPARKRWVTVVSKGQAPEEAKDRSRLVLRPSGVDSVFDTENPAPTGLLPNSWREENGVPFFAKKGWTRPKENAAKHECPNVTQIK